MKKSDSRVTETLEHLSISLDYEEDEEMKVIRFD